MTTITQDLSSIGHAAAVLQRHPGTIRKIATQLGISPSVRLNDVDYFAAEDIERIGQHIRQQKEATRD